ncbi:hypothetical protein BOA8489_01247 [Boseongicola aestuarii]|uniref:Uncharacterized protein n=1 Tax=Boseongicola aestuarii TaxID=1470561 RepID=A0A238IZQ9_9RHOB|nr:hypothetical protein BOA8489_01247 [Boseongicola aestuarii]
MAVFRTDYREWSETWTVSGDNHDFESGNLSDDVPIFTNDQIATQLTTDFWGETPIPSMRLPATY